MLHGRMAGIAGKIGIRPKAYRLCERSIFYRHNAPCCEASCDILTVAPLPDNKIQTELKKTFVQIILLYIKRT